jgi:rubrerythrin
VIRERRFTLDFETFQEAIGFAKEKEDAAIHFYESAGQVAKNPGSKVMFGEMADEERKHFKFLDEMQEEDIQSFPVTKIQDLKISQYTQNVPFNPDLDYRQILIVAMKKEEEAYKLYSDLADMTSNSKLSKLFHILAREEAKHKLKLESEYEDHVLQSW